ncbi:MAG: tRNA 4-thiouridine(8) synthase ThiI [Ruminococcus sp.]|uniref:tRNA uracil 4-sulfurtransferase ThiI n=1 Tax=Ruminococcus sp. TaxID=41978 RepID=UPI001B5E8CF3|nr:tRNA uracil 4-sulfurtransferase ThiI [Ruminococcus sp.]MBO4493801.1 tRNA 4-thiouridine(8) synthase ThiI [Ruminococcus sp.]MBP5432431.1 tRNA 4-thiouridine(8) synthase ThiI [Ruminococcus sp.]
MKELILVKYGEMALKGLNKKTFEDMLIKNIKRRLKPLGHFQLTSAQSTTYITPLDEEIDLNEAADRVGKIFGIATYCRACVCEKDFEDICNKSYEYLDEVLSCARTFKVNAKRSDKAFPMKSPEICMELGGKLLEKFPNLTVDVKNPEVTVTVEIRDENAFVHAENIKGAGGLPVGSSGKALLLLSGGIDSPVAGYMMAKRGVHIAAIHYVSPPYTSDRAQLKVEQLCQKLTDYCGGIAFYCVPFTELQEAIKDHCPEEFFTIIMRRLMMEIAQRIAAKDNCLALITGESVGQVASQTMAAMVCTDAVCRIPVFRPCVGMDKTEIIEVARKIDTFDTSVLPYEDCCTVFTPRHPKVRPQLADIEKAQNSYDFEPLIQKAVDNTEMKTFNYEDSF